MLKKEHDASQTPRRRRSTDAKRQGGDDPEPFRRGFRSRRLLPEGYGPAPLPPHGGRESLAGLAAGGAGRSYGRRRNLHGLRRRYPPGFGQGQDRRGSHYPGSLRPRGLRAQDVFSAGRNRGRGAVRGGGGGPSPAQMVGLSRPP